METTTGFMISKQLLNCIEEVKHSHKVGAAIYENMPFINSGGFIYFDISTDGSIMAKNERHVMEFSIHKWARALLTNTNYDPVFRLKKTLWDYYEVTDRDIELFGNYIKGLCQKNNFTIEVVKGAEIPKLFSEKRQPRELRGRLHKSCMNEYPEYFGMIARCEDASAVAIIDNVGMLIGRALLWNVDIGGMDKVKFLDRFYTSRDYLDGVLIKWASENNVWRKKYYDRYENPKQWVSPTQKDARIVGSINIAAHGYKYYPYLDTFCYGGDDFISNDQYGAKYFYQGVFGDRLKPKN